MQAQPQHPQQQQPSTLGGHIAALAADLMPTSWEDFLLTVLAVAIAATIAVSSHSSSPVDGPALPYVGAGLYMCVSAGGQGCLCKIPSLLSGSTSLQVLYLFVPDLFIHKLTRSLAHSRPNRDACYIGTADAAGLAGARVHHRRPEPVLRKAQALAYA